jgi:hypothetical protein
MTQWDNVEFGSIDEIDNVNEFSSVDKIGSKG